MDNKTIFNYHQKTMGLFDTANGVFFFRFLRNEKVLFWIRCKLFAQWGLLSNEKCARKGRTIIFLRGGWAITKKEFLHSISKEKKIIHSGPREKKRGSLSIRKIL